MEDRVHRRLILAMLAPFLAFSDPSCTHALKWAKFIFGTNLNMDMTNNLRKP